jgi:hypothetical protein
MLVMPEIEHYTKSISLIHDFWPNYAFKHENQSITNNKSIWFTFTDQNKARYWISFLHSMLREIPSMLREKK